MFFISFYHSNLHNLDLFHQSTIISALFQTLKRKKCGRSLHSSRYGLVDPRTLSIPLTLFDIWKVPSKMTFTFPAILYSATLFLLYLCKIQLLSIRKWHLMCMRESGKGGELTRAGHTWLSPGLAKSDQHSINQRVQNWNYVVHQLVIFAMLKQNTRARKGGKLTRAGHTWLSPGLAKSDQH